MPFYKANQRNIMQVPLTFNQVKIKCEQLFAASTMFGKFLTNENGEYKEGNMLKENNGGEIMLSFRELRWV
jgi:hypothetical protein